MARDDVNLETKEKFKKHIKDTNQTPGNTGTYARNNLAEALAANDELKEFFDKNLQTKDFWIRFTRNARENPVNDDNKYILRTLTLGGMQNRLRLFKKDAQNKYYQKGKVATRYSDYAIWKKHINNKKSKVDDNGWVLAYLAPPRQAKTKEDYAKAGIRCEICDKDFTSPSGFKKHNTNKHNA